MVDGKEIKKKKNWIKKSFHLIGVSFRYAHNKKKKTSRKTSCVYQLTGVSADKPSNASVWEAREFLCRARQGKEGGEPGRQQNPSGINWKVKGRIRS